MVGNVPNEDLSHILRQFASSRGLSLGFASAAPFEAEEVLLLDRLRAGTYPAFASKVIRRRCRPQELLPGARSLISVALPYGPESIRPKGPWGDPGSQPHAVRTMASRLEGNPFRERLRRLFPRGGTAVDGPQGRLARYACLPDYHLVLIPELHRLARIIEKAAPSSRWQAFVDTGPPLDRSVACRSGLGRFGKNCCIFVPGKGSWVFLGELLCTALLPADLPEVRSIPGLLACRSCNRCLQECPSGALRAPFQHDPRRCISYLTQMRGIIPKEHREHMGNWVLGCDACQDCCPENGRAAPRRGPGSKEDCFGDGASLPLIRLIEMSDALFEDLFGGTPAAFAGLTAIRRNAVTAAGNSPDAILIPALCRALGDPSSAVRASAAWSLGRAGTRQARTALESRLRQEQDPQVTAEIREALE